MPITRETSQDGNIPGCQVYQPSLQITFRAHPGRNANVYMGSAELAAICSRLGRILTEE